MGMCDGEQESESPQTVGYERADRVTYRMNALLLLIWILLREEFLADLH